MTDASLYPLTHYDLHWVEYSPTHDDRLTVLPYGMGIQEIDTLMTRMDDAGLIVTRLLMNEATLRTATSDLVRSYSGVVRHIGGAGSMGLLAEYYAPWSGEAVPVGVHPDLPDGMLLGVPEDAEEPPA